MFKKIAIGLAIGLLGAGVVQSAVAARRLSNKTHYRLYRL